MAKPNRPGLFQAFCQKKETGKKKERNKDALNTNKSFTVLNQHNIYLTEELCYTRHFDSNTRKIRPTTFILERAEIQSPAN